jgi:hypothetical protein
MPTKDETTICTSNSAEWCDRVCRAHGVPGTFTPEIWFQPWVGPPYYSNAITLTRSGLTEQYAAIAQLEENLPQGFSVKDAFANLDLTKSGFHVLFDAEWIWFEPSPVARPENRNPSWFQVKTEHELIRWEAAWAASGSPTASRVFLPTLLADASLAFFGAQRDGQIVAGCVANRSRAGVVGFSNFFAPDSGRDRYRSEAVALVANFAKGNPLVGYDRGAELEGLLAIGFRCVGPLRVWVRP